MLGWTQDEISAKLQELWPDAKGNDQSQVARFLCKKGKDDFCKKIADDLTRGHSIDTLSKRYALPPVLVWALKLQSLDDQSKFDALSIKIQPYDVWHFNSCNPLFGSEHPGRIPGELVAHVLYFFTEPGNLIIDPMAGSGTTIDVCLAMGRKCYAYDADLRHNRPPANIIRD